VAAIIGAPNDPLLPTAGDQPIGPLVAQRSADPGRIPWLPPAAVPRRGSPRLPRQQRVSADIQAPPPLPRPVWLKRDGQSRRLSLAWLSALPVGQSLRRSSLAACRAACGLGQPRMVSLIHDALEVEVERDQGEPLLSRAIAQLVESSRRWASNLRVRQRLRGCSRRWRWLWGRCDRCCTAASPLRIRQKAHGRLALPDRY